MACKIKHRKSSLLFRMILVCVQAWSQRRHLFKIGRGKMFLVEYKIGQKNRSFLDVSAFAGVLTCEGEPLPTLGEELENNHTDARVGHGPSTLPGRTSKLV